jgi:argininosuccinate lyase
VVGDRDFLLELLQIASQLMLHLSRLAEDFIYLSSTAVHWIELPDSLCTGSSMMPQKKNLDVLELTRGKTASVLGHASAMAVLLKGLPTSYHRDLQQDKEHLFSAVDDVSGALEVIPLVIGGFRVNAERIQNALQKGFLMATDLAEYLVTRGSPFRVARLENELTLEEVPLEKLQELAPECGPEVSEVLKPESSLRRRWHKGSSGLVPIEQQIVHWKEWIENLS